MDETAYDKRAETKRRPWEAERPRIKLEGSRCGSTINPFYIVNVLLSSVGIPLILYHFLGVSLLQGLRFRLAQAR